MNKAFLSHSSAQKELVRKIAKFLGPARCIIDEMCFDDGHPIMDEILRKMNDADMFVLFVSNESLNSDWVRKEIFESEKLQKSGKIKCFLPIRVDFSVDPAKDKRLPDWIRGYLMNLVVNPHRIYQMIANNLRELEMEMNPTYVAKRNLFVGRHTEMQELEEVTNSRIDPFFECIFVSGLEGIGRRTFLRRFLQSENVVNPSHDPIFAVLNSRSSIDNFLLFLIQEENDAVTNKELEEMGKMSQSQKVDKCRSMLSSLLSENFYLFIIDNGCIVRPNKKVVDWFSQIIDYEGNKSTYFISVISKYRPSMNYLQKHPEYISINLDALSVSETLTLYNKYSRILKVEPTDKHRKIIDVLNGIPSQVYYSVETVKSFGIDYAVRNLDSIVDYGDKPVLEIISLIKKRGKLSWDLFILLCHLRTCSYDMIYDIAGDTDGVNEELEYFFILGVFSLFGPSKEYIEVQSAIADYIKRSNIPLKLAYERKMQDSVEDFVNNKDENSEFVDLSRLYHEIKGVLIKGVELPSRYYLPSYVLDSISDLYDNGNYEPALSLTDKMLNSQKDFSRETRREFQYWLCLILARLKNKRFEQEITKIDGADYFFLYGFFFRLIHRLDEAETYFNKALFVSPNHQRAKRELVNVYVMKGDYEKGLSMAKDNFERQKTNPFHIQAYFICLIQTNSDNIQPVKDELDQLMVLIHKLNDPKAKSISITMEGNYAYFVEHNALLAEKILMDNIMKTNNLFSCKTLEDIYHLEGNIDGVKRMKEIIKKGSL